MRRPVLTAVMRLFACLFALTWCGVLKGHPSWHGTIHPRSPGPHAPLTPRKLEYLLSWKGSMDAGKIVLNFAPPGVSKPGLRVVTGSAASTGAAAALFPYSSSLWAEINPATLRPRYFRAVETTSGETETTTNRFTKSALTSERHTVPKKGTTTRYTNTFPYPAADLASAILFVRSQPLPDGATLRLLTHPYHTPYLVDLIVTGREIKDGRPAIRLLAQLQKLDRKTYEPVPYKKLKGPAILWISDDADRIPLELRAPVFIGDVRAVLISDVRHP